MAWCVAYEGRLGTIFVVPLNRPNPEIVKAKLREIAQRYRRKHKGASKPQFASIRLTELNRLFMARHGLHLPNDEQGRVAVMIAAHHLMQLAGHPRERIMDWIGLRAPWMTIMDMNTLLAEIAVHPRLWKADSLGWRLRLTDQDRTTLRITTIGAIDCNKGQRLKRRMHKSKIANQERRKKARVAKALAANTA